MNETYVKKEERSRRRDRSFSHSKSSHFPAKTPPLLKLCPARFRAAYEVKEGGKGRSTRWCGGKLWRGGEVIMSSRE